MSTTTDLEHAADLLLGIAPPSKTAGRRTVQGPWRRFRSVLREEELRPAEERLFGQAIERMGYRTDGSLALDLTTEERRTLFCAH